MSLARRLLLRASRSDRLAAELRRRAFFRRAVRRFMPGEDLGAALAAAAELSRAGLGSVLTELGEQVTTHAEADAVFEHYLDVLGRIRAAALPTQLSVKLTHLGLDLDRDGCARHVGTLAARAAEARSFLWIDMEESRYVDATLDVFAGVRAQRDNVGVCLQAYLRRTPADLDRLLPLAPAIRLVKGAYSEPSEVAYPRKRDVDAAYFQLAERLLVRAARREALPIFGTHDLRLLRRIRAHAAATGVPRDGFEIHMLYGIKTADQRTLAADGCTVRVLISYGNAWFPWYLRRLAERPANVWFVLRNLF